MGTTLVEGGIPGERQLARGVDITRQHRSDSLARLRTDKPCLHDSGHLVNPRHSCGITRYVDIHQSGVDLQYSLYHLVLRIGQLVAPAVVTLAVLIVAFVQSTKEDNHIGILGLRHRLGGKRCL